MPESQERGAGILGRLRRRSGAQDEPDKAPEQGAVGTAGPDASQPFWFVHGSAPSSSANETDVGNGVEQSGPDAADEPVAASSSVSDTGAHDPAPDPSARSVPSSQPTRAQVDPEAAGGDAKRVKWLPTGLQQEENPLTSDEWLPEEHPAALADPEHATAPDQPGTAKPAPSSSWMPPGLDAEPDDQSLSASAGAAAVSAPEPEPAPRSEPPPSPPEPASQPDESKEQQPVAAPRPLPAAAPEPAPDDAQPARGFPLGEVPAHGRRGRAVEAYCHELFPAEVAHIAADQILNSLTGGIREDAVLLEAIRTAAAERLRVGHKANGAAGDTEAGDTFRLLAARANGTITERERARLEIHLASCVVCRAAELRAARADRAFAGITGPAQST